MKETKEGHITRTNPSFLAVSSELWDSRDMLLKALQSLTAFVWHCSRPSNMQNRFNWSACMGKNGLHSVCRRVSNI